MNRLLILLLAVSGFAPLHAQFVFGWSGGWAPARELNREIYVYNAINGHNLDKEMGEVHWYQGPVIGFRMGGDGAFAELLYNRKRCKVASEFDSAGVAMTREMKTLCNTYNLGFGYESDKWRIGMSFDAGRFKGFGRRGKKDGIGDVEWERIWVKDNTRLYFIAIYRLYVTATVFVEKRMGPVGLRAFWQIPGIRSDLDGLDNWLFGGDLNYALSQKQSFWNFGMALTVQLGGNR